MYRCVVTLHELSPVLGQSSVVSDTFPYGGPISTDSRCAARIQTHRKACQDADAMLHNPTYFGDERLNRLTEEERDATRELVARAILAGKRYGQTHRGQGRVVRA